MKKNKPYTKPEYFENRLKDLEKRFLSYMIFKYNQKISIARDKELVIEEQIKNHFLFYHICFKNDEYRKSLIERFEYYYVRGLPIDDLVIEKSTEIKDALRAGEKLEQKIVDFGDPYKIVNWFGKYAAYYQFIKIYKNDFPKLYEEMKEASDYNSKVEHLSDASFNTNIDEDLDDIINPKEITNSRQTLVMVFLLDELKISNNDNTKKAKLISMLTGKSQNTIRKLLSNLGDKSEASQIKDLEFILPYFQDLGIQPIENKIQAKIRDVKKGIENQTTKNL